MKKELIILPLLVIVSIALFAFKPLDDGGGVTSVITCSDGTVIIPSTVNMTTADQQAMISILNSYGSDAGYLVYKNTDGTTGVYNAPLDPDALSEIDSEFGSDLAQKNAASGWTFYKAHICLTMITVQKYRGSTTTIALHDDLAQILSKYGYTEQ